MEKDFDVITALDTCVDFLVNCGDTEPEFGQKEKLIDGYALEMGGSACIFACQCAKLGLKTAGVGMVGSDYMGDIVMNSLNNSGVDTSFVRKSPDAKTGLGVLLTKNNGDRSILTYMGTIDKVKSEWLNVLLPRTKHLHICSYFLHRGLQQGYKDIVRIAKKHNVTISLDTNWDPDENWDSGINDILPYVDIFLPNENELLYLARQKNVSDALRHLGNIVPIIALKCGENGAHVYHKGNVIKMDALKVSAVDTVGAGDSFNGGFIYGFLSKLPIEECLRVGIICGSQSVRKAGGISGQPDLSDMLKKFRTTNI